MLDANRSGRAPRFISTRGKYSDAYPTRRMPHIDASSHAAANVSSTPTPSLLRAIHTGAPPGTLTACSSMKAPIVPSNDAGMRWTLTATRFASALHASDRRPYR